MSETLKYDVEITIDGPVMENMSKVTVKGLGSDETFYVDHDDMQQYSEPELKIELMMYFAGTDTRNALQKAETIGMNDYLVDMNAVRSMFDAINKVRNF
jgi:hypothetical protein